MALHLHQWDREAKLEENQCGGQVTGGNVLFKASGVRMQKPTSQQIHHAVDLLFEVQVGISRKLIEIQA